MCALCAYLPLTMSVHIPPLSAPISEFPTHHFHLCTFPYDFLQRILKHFKISIFYVFPIKEAGDNAIYEKQQVYESSTVQDQEYDKIPQYPRSNEFFPKIRNPYIHIQNSRLNSSKIQIQLIFENPNSKGFFIKIQNRNFKKAKIHDLMIFNNTQQIQYFRWYMYVCILDSREEIFHI